MNRVVSLVGSAAGCKFRLADPSVSLFHCSLVRSQTGLWVVDLLGGGIEVNNTAVRYAMLEDDDVLSIGRYRIRVRSRPALEGPRSEAGRDRGTSRSISLVRTPPSSSSTMIAAARVDDESGMVVRAQPVAILPTEIQGAGMGDSASVLVPLMNQFGVMQQQMLDQFQSAMGMLVEMFGSLQREQMDLIRQELDQLREVTREFQELKAELASYTRERARTAETTPPSVEPAVLVEAPAIPTAPSATAIASGSIVPEAPRHEKAEPVANPAIPSEPVIPAPPSPDADGLETSTRIAAAAGTADQRRGARAASARPRPEKVPRPDGSDGDVMLWLNQRIATLQEERETRWQKILKLLPGSS
jgi:hypothetical protein